MAEHTPGPWRVRYHKSVPDQVAAVMSDHELICAIYGEANARLIAAAPELLAALEQALAISQNLRLLGRISTRSKTGLPRSAIAANNPLR